ncbi:MAG TPA: response regulator [Candidatus Limnocylindrales bacterium]|nr:response regulator [Candidatus Limnocylindrales bacterium]
MTARGRTGRTGGRTEIQSERPAGDDAAAGRVLIVDDTPFNRQLLARLLRGLGHDPVEAGDGREALARLRDAEAPAIDVILLDIVMPEMDGYEVLAALRDDPALSHIPVIVISGVDELDSVVRCLEMGAADYLPKTVDPAILKARIASSLARKRLHDAERESIDRQAASNEVLAIMSRSAFDLQVVLDAVVRAAVRLCRADYGVAYLLEGDTYRVAASAGGTGELDDWERHHPIGPGRDSVVGRVALIGEAISLDDVLADREYFATPGQQVAGYRTLLGVPIAQDGSVTGVLALTRNEVRPFGDADRALATGFAEQAAIGIANARLLETIERQRGQLARFLSPQVASLVSSPDGEALLAGHRREITAMFCDLRNFTGFSESAEPEEVLGFLRRYHATVGALVVDHEGTLEHFAGDGIMVFFNDPELQADHAARAVRMAVAIRERFAEIGDEWRRRGHVLQVGIGIATGYATMGRIGFEGRYDYGGVGNAIILASRLSGEAAPGEILIAQRTFAALDGAVPAEDAGERQLKGFSRPLGVFRVATEPAAVEQAEAS